MSSMKTEELRADMSRRHFFDVTSQLASFVTGAGDGVANIFVPHATAGLAIMETGSGSEEDFAAALDRLLPRDDIYTHRHGSKGHGADHVIPAFIAPSLSIPVLGGELALGTWQSVVLVDLNRDNAQRRIRFSFLPA